MDKKQRIVQLREEKEDRTKKERRRAEGGGGRCHSHGWGLAEVTTAERPVVASELKARRPLTKEQLTLWAAPASNYVPDHNWSDEYSRIIWPLQFYAHVYHGWTQY